MNREGEQISGANYFLTRDHLGSVRELTGRFGNVLARYSYDPYGVRTKLISGSVDADFGFTGHYVHPTSGLEMVFFRSYDANPGRWLNRDPMRETGGLNLYAYVGNNSINLIDPTGQGEIPPPHPGGPPGCHLSPQIYWYGAGEGVGFAIAALTGHVNALFYLAHLLDEDLNGNLTPQMASVRTKWGQPHVPENPDHNNAIEDELDAAK